MLSRGYWRQLAFITRLVAHKGITEGLRDRKTMLMSCGLPFILIPLAVFAGGELSLDWLSSSPKSAPQTRQSVRSYVYIDPSASESVSAALVSESIKNPDQLRTELHAILRRAPQFRLVETTADLQLDACLKEFFAPPVIPQSSPPLPPDRLITQINALIRERRLDAVVALGPYHSLTLLAAPFPVRDSQGETEDLAQSEEMTDRLAHHLVEAVVSLRQERLHERGLGESFSLPYRIGSVTLSDREKARTHSRHQALGALGTLIAYLSVIIVTLGAFYPALAASARENEEGTLGVLLRAVPQLYGVVLGKFTSTLCFALLSIVSYLASLSISGTVLLWLGHGLPQLGHYPIAQWLTVYNLGVLIPCAWISSAVAIAIGFACRTQSEAQAFLSLLVPLLLLPSLAVLTRSTDTSFYYALIPLYNCYVISARLFVQSPSLTFITTTFVVNGAAGLCALRVAQEFLAAEVHADPNFSDILSHKRLRLSHAIPATSFLCFALVLVLSLYLNFVGTVISPLGTVALIELSVCLGIPIALCRMYRLRLRPTFALLAVGYRAYFEALGLLLLLVAIVGPLAPKIPREFADLMRKSLAIDSRPLALSLLGVAILPAFCEEWAYRGFIYAGLRSRFTSGFCVVLSALLFAINHFSLYRFLPTFLAGILLAILRERSGSLYPGMALHFALNALTVVGLYRAMDS